MFLLLWTAVFRALEWCTLLTVGGWEGFDVFFNRICKLRWFSINSLLFCCLSFSLLYWIPHVPSPVWFHALLISVNCNWKVKLTLPPLFSPARLIREGGKVEETTSLLQPSCLSFVILPHPLILLSLFRSRSYAHAWNMPSLLDVFSVYIQTWCIMGDMLTGLLCWPFTRVTPPRPNVKPHQCSLVCVA